MAMRIPLEGGINNYRYAFIDQQDFAKHGNLKWTLDTEKLAAFRDIEINGQTKRLYLDREIMGAAPGNHFDVVQCKDKNRLNCSRSNLLLVSNRASSAHRLQVQAAAAKAVAKAQAIPDPTSLGTLNRRAYQTSGFEKFPRYYKSLVNHVKANAPHSELAKELNKCTCVKYGYKEIHITMDTPNRPTLLRAESLFKMYLESRFGFSGDIFTRDVDRGRKPDFKAMQPCPVLEPIPADQADQTQQPLFQDAQFELQSEHTPSKVSTSLALASAAQPDFPSKASQQPMNNPLSLLMDAYSGKTEDEILEINYKIKRKNKILSFSCTVSGAPN